jgi:hypothetical protein
MAVPYAFQTATSAIPLANLDANFAYYDGAFSISGTTTQFLGNVGIGSASTANTRLTLFDTNSSKLILTGGTTQNGMLLNAVSTASQYYIGAGNNLLNSGDKGFLIYDVPNARAKFFVEDTVGETRVLGTTLLTQYTGGIKQTTVDINGNFLLGTSSAFVPSSSSNSLSSCNTFGFKNRLINGNMQIAQRGTSNTSGAFAPTTSPTYPSVDRWYSYAIGATVNVAQIAGIGAIKNNLQITGATSVTSVGVGQRIEQSNSHDLAGSICMLSVNISNSLLTTVTWTVSYAGSADSWATKTQISTGTFTVTNSLTNYSAQINVPANATTGIEILFTVGAQTSGTWVIGNAQIEKGGAATNFDYRSYGTELQLCQRYFYNLISGIFTWAQTGYFYSTSQANIPVLFPTQMRSSPTLSIATGSAYYLLDATGTAITMSSLAIYQSSKFGCLIYGAPSSVGVPGYAFGLVGNNVASFIGFSAEL